MRPGVGEDTGEVFLEVKLLLRLCIGLSAEPSLQSWPNYLSHPLEHILKAGTKPGFPAVQQKDDGVDVIDNICKDVRHLLIKDSIIVVRIFKARGVHYLKE